MTVTNNTSFAPAIPTENLDPLILAYLRHQIVVTPMVRTVDLSGKDGLKYDFNSFGSLSAVSKTAGTDWTPEEFTVVEDGTVTAAEVGLALQIADLARESAHSVNDDDLAREMANALAEKMEVDICAQFKDFTTEKGETGVALAMSHIEDALLALRQAKAPTGPVPNSNLPAGLTGFKCVLSEIGIFQLERSIRQAGGTMASPSMVEMLETFGQKGAAASRFKFLGVDFFGQDLVATTGGDRNGAIFVPAAIGLVTKRAPRLEKQRWAIGSQEYQAASAAYGTNGIKLAFGVELIHVST